MGTIVRNLVAVVVGVVVGGFLNIMLISASPRIIPPPGGVDVTNLESLKLAMHLFEPKHFLMPFLAHALGTLVGGFVASMSGASTRMKLALAVGVVFLAGGVSAVSMIPAPVWFSALDLICAYLPMAWLGGKLAESIRPVSLTTA